MMASISLPVGESVACSVMETTRIPRRRSMDFSGDGVFPFAGKPGELPDENLLERSVGPARLVQHPAELGAVGDAAALGLVDLLAGHGVAVGLGEVP